MKKYYVIINKRIVEGREDYLSSITSIMGMPCWNWRPSLDEAMKFRTKSEAMKIAKQRNGSHEIKLIEVEG